MITALRFDDPWWLVAPVVLTPLTLIALRWFDAMTGLRRWSAILLRTALLLLIAVLLAGTSAVRTTRTLAVVALVDVSESVRRFGDSTRPAGSGSLLAQARAFLDQAAARRGPDDLLGLVAFDGRALALASPTAAPIADRDLDVTIAPGTNIESALRTARALIPPDAAARFLLFSDGNATSGEALALAAERMPRARTAAPIPIDTVALSYRLENEVFVESVDAPPQAAAGSTVSVRVVLQATAPTRGRLRLLREGQSVALTPGADSVLVELTTGTNVRVLEVPLDAGRVHRFEAVFEPLTDATGNPIGDTLLDNNSASAFTLTPGRGSVLLVDGWADRPDAPRSPLGDTLRAAGLRVVSVAPSGVPSDPLGWQEYDLAILENVAADAIPVPSQQLLADMVRGMGLGLLMVGGPDSFGAGGWKGSPLESILPVRLDLPDKVVVPEAAVVLVLDNSGSMRHRVMGSSRSQQEIANQAAALAVTTLDEKDLVGVIVFNSDATTLKTLGPNTSPEATAAEIRAIAPDGGTNLPPALEDAISALRGVEAKAKHIIVLSDGKSQAAEALVPLARAAGTDKIKISTISVGDDADDATMSQMARESGGAFYAVTNPSVLPRVFLRAVRVIRAPLIREGAFTPVVTATGSPLTAGLATPPPLLGLVLTQPRPEATIFQAMLAPTGEPLLTHWNVELGQVAAFTSDASVWARNWLEWPGYQQFWTRAARTLARPDLGRGVRASATVRGTEVQLAVSAFSDDGVPLDGLEIPGIVYSPGGGQLRTRLEQTGPGQYQTTLPSEQAGAYLALLTPRRADGAAMAPVLVGAAVAAGAESRQLQSNPGVLARLSAISGGRVLSMAEASSADLFDRAGLEPVRAFSPLWRLLLPWLIGVFLLDIATRRVAWDRFLYRQHQRKQSAVSVLSPGLTDVRSRADATTASPVIATDSLVLTEADAQALAAAQRDRRRAERLAAAQLVSQSSARESAASGRVSSGATPSVGDSVEQQPGATTSRPAESASPATSENAPPADPEPDSPFLAAKRRVRDRFGSSDS